MKVKDKTGLNFYLKDSYNEPKTSYRNKPIYELVDFYYVRENGFIWLYVVTAGERDGAPINVYQIKGLTVPLEKMDDFTYRYPDPEEEFPTSRTFEVEVLIGGGTERKSKQTVIDSSPTVYWFTSNIYPIYTIEEVFSGVSTLGGRVLTTNDNNLGLYQSVLEECFSSITKVSGTLKKLLFLYNYGDDYWYTINNNGTSLVGRDTDNAGNIVVITSSNDEEVGRGYIDITGEFNISFNNGFQLQNSESIHITVIDIIDGTTVLLEKDVSKWDRTNQSSPLYENVTSSIIRITGILRQLLQQYDSAYKENITSEITNITGILRQLLIQYSYYKPEHIASEISNITGIDNAFSPYNEIYVDGWTQEYNPNDTDSGYTYITVEKGNEEIVSNPVFITPQPGETSVLDFENGLNDLVPSSGIEWKSNIVSYAETTSNISLPELFDFYVDDMEIPLYTNISEAQLITLLNSNTKVGTTLDSSEVLTLSAVNIEEGIQLDWSIQDNSNIIEYKVYRAENNDVDIDNLPSPLVTLNKNITSYVDTTASPGQTYKYIIGGVK